LPIGVETGEIILFARMSVTEMMKWKETLGREGIVLERADKTVLEDIGTRFGFIASVMSVATVVSAALSAGAITIQANRIVERDKKKNAILFSLGANKKDIKKMMVIEMAIVSTSAFLIATMVSVMVSVLFDFILGNHVAQVISMHAGLIVPARRMLASGWIFYPVFFVLANAFTYVATVVVANKNKSTAMIQNLKRE
jgi:ABC-type antimicrobial peptide transport system permease subunit